MKKIPSICLLALLAVSITTIPCSAISDKNKKEKISALEYINFDKWKELNDSYLEGYIIKAINNNYDIKTTALKLEQARLNVMQARSEQLPYVSLGASPAVFKKPGTTKTEGSLALPILAYWEADIFGKNRNKTQSAKKLYEAAELQKQMSDIATISLVAAVYYNIVKLDKIIEIQNELLEARKSIYDIMQISNREGLTSLSDLILAEKSYVMAQNEMLEYNKSRQNALNAIAVLIGDSPNNTDNYKRADAQDLSDEFLVPNEISSDIITNRPDYKAAEIQLQAAGIDVKIAKKEFLPTINILGLMTFLATSSMNSMNWKNSLSLAGISTDLPIFTGFARIVNLKFNKNKYEQLLTQYQKIGLTSIQEVNDSLYNFKTDNEKFKNNIKAFDIQTKDFNLATLKYNNGIISKLDLLQQKENIIYMQKVMLQSKFDCYIDKISLYKTTGAKL